MPNRRTKLIILFTTPAVLILIFAAVPFQMDRTSGLPCLPDDSWRWCNTDADCMWLPFGTHLQYSGRHAQDRVSINSERAKGMSEWEMCISESLISRLYMKWTDYHSWEGLPRFGGPPRDNLHCKEHLCSPEFTNVGDLGN